ncbi:predicted protein, partial [Nematostella vectensis]
GNRQKRLIHDLLDTYNPRARPVTNDNHTVGLKLTIRLQQIMDVDEKNEVIQTFLILEQMWNDTRLAWNETEYGGIKQMTLRSKLIWTPDISVLNSANKDMDLREKNIRLFINSAGEVLWMNPLILHTSCGMDIAHFPFDNQACELRFGSWSTSLRYMDVHPFEDTANLQYFVENGEWILESTTSYRKLKKYGCCESEFPEVTYVLELHRRTLFYTMNFILPCVLIAVLALLVFLLPPESGERMSFGVTVLLSFTILILMLQAKLPVSSKVTPRIAVFYWSIMLEVSAGMFMACLMLRFYYPEQSNAPLPGWVKECVLNYCARIVGLKKTAERVQ